MCDRSHVRNVWVEPSCASLTENRWGLYRYLFYRWERPLVQMIPVEPSSVFHNSLYTWWALPVSFYNACLFARKNVPVEPSSVLNPLLVLSSTRKLLGKLIILSNDIVWTMMKKSYYCSQQNILTTIREVIVLSDIDNIIEFDNKRIALTSSIKIN